MGSALAERFRAGGLRVIGYDLREECRQKLAALGGEPAPSVRAVFHVARTVVLSLPDSRVVDDVLIEAHELVTGATVIDTTTGDPKRTEILGRMLASAGCEYLDATLTGSSAQARA